ncbi:MAG: cupin domain-containing protein [Trebonia sp.]|jgi:uncharacterized RmlC-like cupin family protein
MLRVSKVDDWLNRQPARRDSRANGGCIIIRSAGAIRTGVSGVSADSRALGLNLVMIPPGSRGMPHYHDGHEIALYLVSGETEVWHGADLAKRATVRAGDFIYIPPGTPHVAVNRGDVTSIAVVAKTDPDDDGRTVVIELPRHLAGLLSLPVAIQE